MLNLFGYTGLASLVAARAGAEVTHVDASKKAIGWARENQEMAGLDDKPIRWICEDAMKFAEREERRGSRYDIILFDPPAYGRGPKGEVWQLFEDLPVLTDICRAILTPKPLAVVLTAYSIRASFFAIHALMRDSFAGMGGTVESGELVIREKAGRPGAFDLAVLALGGGMSMPEPARRTRAPGQVKEVTSLANPLVKDIKALALKKFRDQQNAFMAEGLKLVIDALDLGWSIRTLVFAKTGLGNPAVEKVAARTVAAGGTGARGHGKGAVGHHPARQSADGASASSPRNTCRSSDIRAGRRRRLGGARSRARSRQSRHRHPHRRCGRRQGRHPGRRDHRSVLGGDGARHHGFGLRRAGRPATPEQFLAWRKGFPGLVAGTHLKGAVDYRSIDYAGRPVLLLMGNEQQGLPDELGRSLRPAAAHSAGRPRRFAQSRRGDRRHAVRNPARAR